MRWQIISLLHSLVLAPALTLHSLTFTLCEGHAGHKLYEQPFDVQGCCVVHQHILTVTGIGYYLINVQDKKPYTTGQKLMAQKLKDRRMMKTGFLPAVPEHFTPKHPTETLHPSFRGRSVAFPSAEWRNTVTFHLRWEEHKACSSQTRLCHAAEFIRASLLVI